MLGRLMRRQDRGTAGVALGVCRFAVIDLETTGLFAHAHDRVIEVAVVDVDARERAIVDEWTTLVNPARDLGLSALHGIWGRDLADAPTFATIAGDLLERLDGAVLAAHNARFDHGFLRAEFERLHVELPRIPSVCTMDLAARLSSARGRGLAQCCAELRIARDGDHVALNDARAAATLLLHCLAAAERDGVGTLAALGCATTFPDPSAWPRIPASGRAFPRRGAAPPPEQTYLARLVGRLGVDDGGGLGDEARAYLDVLDRALEDRHLSNEESDDLFALAGEWGISHDEALELHQQYLRQLVAAARADGVVTDPERRDLELVADVLAVDRARLRRLFDVTATAAIDGSAHSRPRDDLGDKSVCFTGALTSTIAGEPITRERAQQLAQAAGLVVCPAVTKKLDLLVVADPDSLSGKAQKARKYGTRIIAEPAFWRAIGIEVD
jgi:DNA polymerase III subunit epsilon